MTYSEMIKIIDEHNKENKVHGQWEDKNPLYFAIVYKKENWIKTYSEKSRTYIIRSDEKRFIPTMGGTSMYGDCLDGVDLGVRLDHYDWDIERIYQYEGK